METKPGDILLIHKQEEPVVYARVEEIVADVKPHWWQIRLLILHPPAQEATWILREEYIDGDNFTMGGEPLRLERLGPPSAMLAGGSLAEDEKPAGQDNASENNGEKVVSLFHRRPRD